MLSGGPVQWPQPPPVPAGRSRCCARRCGECGRRAGPRGPGIGASGPRRPPQHAAPEERLSPLVHLEPRRRHVSVTPNPRDAAGGVCEVRVPRSARSRRRRAPPPAPASAHVPRLRGHAHRGGARGACAVQRGHGGAAPPEPGFRGAVCACAWGGAQYPPPPPVALVTRASPQSGRTIVT